MMVKVFITRKWPEAVEQKLKENFDVTLRHDDIPVSYDEFKQAVQHYDAILPTVSDKLPPDMFEQKNMKVKILGNFGVGYNHIDIKAAEKHGIIVTNTPGVLTDCTADLAIGLIH